VLQENLAGVFEGFTFDVADRQAEERTNFGLIKHGIAKAFVLLNDSASASRTKEVGRAAMRRLQAKVVVAMATG